MKTAKEFPKKIWLQREEGEHPECDTYYGEGMTWCEDKINKDDVEYMRADLVNSRIQQACKEQRKLCGQAYIMQKGHHLEENINAITNAPEPDLK